MGNRIYAKDAANYIITLYKQTNYQCDRQKLQKLVIFADLLYFAVVGERLLDETTVTATERGLAVAALSTPPYGRIFNYVNENKTIDISEFDGNLVIQLNPIYDYRFEALSDDVRRILCYTFCHFGAYSGEDLTSLSRNTSLWYNARKSDNISNAPFVTTELYIDFLNSFLNKSTLRSAEEIRMTVVRHLKGCLSNGSNPV